MRYIILIAVVLGFWYLSFLNEKDARAIEFDDCIYMEARGAGFNGTQEEAWKIFAPLCAHYK